MNTNLTRSVTVLALLLTTAATAPANDIVNFLKALNGNSGRRNAPVVVQPVGNHGHAHGGAAYGNQGHGGHGSTPQFGGSGTHRPPVNTVNLRPNHNVAPPARSSSGLQINLRFGANGSRNPGYGSPVYVPAPRPVQVLPQAPIYPAPPTCLSVAPAPFQLGQFINYQVPLETRVQVQDEFNIAPNAVPVIIAVRDPNMCRHDNVERLVYVQIFVPQCPLRDLQVSPCRTRVSLDYGRFEVDIKSGNGVIVIDYDN
jgi:hypothetical protein